MAAEHMWAFCVNAQAQLGRSASGSPGADCQPMPQILGCLEGEGVQHQQGQGKVVHLHRHSQCDASSQLSRCSRMTRLCASGYTCMLGTGLQT